MLPKLVTPCDDNNAIHMGYTTNSGELGQIDLLDPTRGRGRAILDTDTAVPPLGDVQSPSRKCYTH